MLWTTMIYRNLILQTVCSRKWCSRIFFSIGYFALLGKSQEILFYFLFFPISASPQSLNTALSCSFEFVLQLNSQRFSKLPYRCPGFRIRITLMRFRLFNVMRILLLRKVIRIRDHWPTDLSGLLNLDFNAYPDPALHSNALSMTPETTCSRDKDDTWSPMWTT
jgi:hypothetical protein